MALSDDILSATVRHSIYLERYKARIVKDVLALVREVEDSITTAAIKADIERLNRRELEQLLANLKKRIDAGYQPVAELIDMEVKGLASYEAQWQLDMFRSTVPVDLSWKSPADAQIYAATVARPFNGMILKEWMRGLPDGQFSRIRQTIRQGYVEGRTTAQIVQDIVGTRDRKGIADVSRRAAETATRTALAHTANVARNEVFRANRSLLKGVEWVSVLDGRTSAFCRAMDGRVLPLDSGPRPPAHPNCRSAVIPSIKSSKALGLKDLPPGTRASMNGQVSAELNYDAWLRQQPVSFQDEVLGRSKGRLFRAGLKMDRFIDRGGNELTLEQLKERESAIWAKSGLGG